MDTIEKRNIQIGRTSLFEVVLPNSGKRSGPCIILDHGFSGVQEIHTPDDINDPNLEREYTMDEPISKVCCCSSGEN
jgi:hypothetical protein